MIGSGGPMSSVRASVDHQPLQDPAEFGVPFFISAQIGRKVIEGPHRPPNIRERQAGQHFAVRDGFRRERDGNREDAGSDAGLSGRNPERGGAPNRKQLRLRVGNVVEEESCWLSTYHAEIGQICVRIAHEKIVDVVLARVHAGRKRGPRRR